MPKRTTAPKPNEPAVITPPTATATAEASAPRARMTEGKSRRQPWTEWWPKGIAFPEDERLLTIPETVSRLKKHGVVVDADDVRYWGHIGVLPGPTRRRRDGATRGLYPEVIVDAIRELRWLKASGMPLEDTRWLIRDRFQLAAFEDSNPSDEEVAAFDEKQQAAKHRFHLPEDVADGLRQIAKARSTITGIPQTVEITIFGSDGRRLVYVIDEAGNVS
jgi:DNA-binding transcriptional MerR regulator